MFSSWNVGNVDPNLRMIKLPDNATITQTSTSPQSGCSNDKGQLLELGSSKHKL